MYRFNLEILRKYRKRQEEEIQKDLSERKRELNKEKEQLQKLDHSRENACRQQKRIQQREFKAPENLLYYQYINKLEERISKQNTLVSESEDKFSLKYDELIEAVKKRKIMEILKERGRIKYVSESNKKDQKNLDDMGIIGFQRKNTERI